MIDSWERQRRSFENTAENYDRYRPSYPRDLFDDVRAYADLGPHERILDIGCGTGRATQFFAEWGNPVVAIEPAPGMADIARNKLPTVDVRTARFEDANLEPDSFGLVATAQAFHWLDPETRVERIARCLRPGGTAAIIANVQVNPEETLTFWRRIDRVYREHVPVIAHKGEFRSPADLPPHALESADLFEGLEQRVRRWQWTLETNDYLGLMRTHSPHASLDEATRERLLNGLRALIDDEFDGRVTEHYAAIADLARRA